MKLNESTPPVVSGQPAAEAPADPESEQSAAVETLTPREWRFAVVLCFFGMLLYFLVNIHRVAIPGQIFSQLQAELKASASAIAGLGTSFMYIYAATQLAVGVLVDRYGGMRISVLGGVIMVGLAVSPARPISGCSSPDARWARRRLRHLCLVKECARLSRTLHHRARLHHPLRYSGIAGTYPFVAVKAWGWRSGMLGITLVRCWC